MKKTQKNFAVVGNPISHSLSPGLFDSFAKQNNIDYCYSRILCRNVEQAIEIIEAFDIKGINITSPFKKDILKYVNKKSNEVKILNAANTVVWNEQKIAYNTDVEGVWGPLSKYIDENKKVLILGAGGAAKAAILAMKNIDVKNIAIVNRSAENARKLAEKFSINHLSLADIGKYKYDVVINTIPVKYRIVEKIKFDENTIVFDANYKNKPLMQLALKNNSIYVDGVEWLLAQGKKSYYMMTGLESEKLIMDDSYYKKMKNKSKIISLIGPMASGKSRVGIELSKKLGYDFVDMDKLIEEREGMSINEIFESKGEDYFRRMEKELLIELVSLKRLIISTGGGVILNEKNIDLIRNKSWNILFYTSPEVASKRINTDKRPLLNNENIEQTLSDIFNERKDRYFKASDLIVNRNAFGVDKNTDINNTIELIYEDYNKAFAI